MHQPDSSVAFDADANRNDPEDVAAMRARIAELEARQHSPTEPAVEIIDPGAPDTSVEVSKVHEATVAGTVFQFHVPKPAALMAFGLGTANRRNGELMMRTMQQFLSFHLLEESFDSLLERMSDPADEFGDDEFGDLMNHVIDVAADSAEAKAPKNGPRR
ncbi:hypothetical protein B842_03315 [Corynebacterium humireducens NBRC 106098 = DSM 45392]|uniref:Uncharacterized protein n=1 Tax=Corynebacterium humireducens NBRC 106098 = DSM 45392 TaxID=1223515 RepID=A0A0B5D1K9_9CORY|nr:hypothetical protein [Corynebacterium humireducens]AJE32516.1 hypothetical protein B842_03315 [Corynebacterium humireducens NBRC 106098 = DSM 45392]